MTAQADSEKGDSALKTTGLLPHSADIEEPVAAEQDSTPKGNRRPGAKAGLSLAQFWIVMCGLSVGMLLAALDFNTVATAVPIVSSEFNAYNNLLGDIFGRRNMFMFGTLFFILGSGLRGGSKSMDMLIRSRSILVWAIADVAGPLLGGGFSEFVTWRCLIITFFYLRIPTPKIDKGRIKIRPSPGTPPVSGCFIGGFALVLTFAIWEHYAEDPLMPLVFIRSRAIAAILFADFFYGANLLGMMVGVILMDVQKVKILFEGKLYDPIVDAYAESLQNGWWWAVCLRGRLLVSSAFVKQREVVGR
ncbi:hypothetical protein BDV11DRAFT_203686 [Aspergillus similis]